MLLFFSQYLIDISKLNAAFLKIFPLLPEHLFGFTMRKRERDALRGHL